MGGIRLVALFDPGGCIRLPGSFSYGCGRAHPPKNRAIQQPSDASRVKPQVWKCVAPSGMTFLEPQSRGIVNVHQSSGSLARRHQPSFPTCLLVEPSYCGFRRRQLDDQARSRSTLSLIGSWQPIRLRLDVSGVRKRKDRGISSSSSLAGGKLVEPILLGRSRRGRSSRPRALRRHPRCRQVAMGDFEHGSPRRRPPLPGANFPPIFRRKRHLRIQGNKTSSLGLPGFQSLNRGQATTGASRNPCRRSCAAQEKGFAEAVSSRLGGA